MNDPTGIKAAARNLLDLLESPEWRRMRDEYHEHMDRRYEDTDEPYEPDEIDHREWVRSQR